MVKGRFSFAVAIATGLAFFSVSQNSQATDWTGATSDMNDAANWGGTLPTASIGTFHETGSHSPVMASDFNTRALYLDEDAVTPYTITGAGILSITQVGLGGSGGFISSAADVDLTIDVAQFNMTRSNGLVTGDYSTVPANSGTGNLTIGSSVGGAMLFMWGGGSTSHNPQIIASNGSPNAGTTITIYPKVDFSGVTSSSSSNNFTVAPGATSVIKLLGGITGGATPTGGNPSKRLHTEGAFGGKTILGDSTGWLGLAQLNLSDLEINSNNSLGEAGSDAASYTWIFGGASTGALRLTNDITSGEFFYITCRTTADFPLIRNISGSNTLTGELVDDNNIDGFTVLSSDGTATGDLIKIEGNVTRSGVGNNSSLVLTGAGDGWISGNITQTTGIWSSLQKTGDGAWTLSGANDYTGTTAVSAGTLIVNGTHTGGGVYTIDANAILAGGSTNLAANLVVDGTLKPGNSIGTFTINGDVDLNGILAVEYDSDFSTIDLLNVTGEFDLTGATFNFSDLGSSSLSLAPYVFATYGTLVGNPAVEVGVPLGFVVNYAFSGNQIALVPVPEPSAIVLMGFAMLGLRSFGRRRHGWLCRG